ncbi:hypothetical protein Pla110_38390 [Polystyrenella longa]|uniref:Uncharacterized protein n=1 Tax=Polystyrenella longa TaxID=2528007 RepID=A0A518CSA9_9PLAN|nr:hypothetical protein [Polystyrenella longa]QDU82084.1 hypothetical protein Pla110_38390 [Polystyrenella longa]
MSSIGSGNIGTGALNIVGSLTGTQKSSATQSNDNKAEAAAQKFQLDQKAMSEKTQDVAAADMSPDRDADGRADYHSSTPHDELDLNQPPAEEKPEPETNDSKPTPFDDQETGQVLDLEA